MGNELSAKSSGSFSGSLNSGSSQSSSTNSSQYNCSAEDLEQLGCKNITKAEICEKKLFSFIYGHLETYFHIENENILLISFHNEEHRYDKKIYKNTQELNKYYEENNIKPQKTYQIKNGTTVQSLIEYCEKLKIKAYNLWTNNCRDSTSKLKQQFSVPEETLNFINYAPNSMNLEIYESVKRLLVTEGRVAIQMNGQQSQNIEIYLVIEDFSVLVIQINETQNSISILYYKDEEEHRDEYRKRGYIPHYSYTIKKKITIQKVFELCNKLNNNKTLQKLQKELKNKFS